MSFTALDRVHHKNAHIIYTAEGNVLDANEKGELFRANYCLCGRLFWWIADFVTCGRFSSARRERVFTAMMRTITKIDEHLKKFKADLEIQMDTNSVLSRKEWYNACDQLVTYPKHGTYTSTEPLAHLKDRISLISTSNISLVQRLSLLHLARNISNTVDAIKKIAPNVNDTPVTVAAGRPAFEIMRSATT